MKCSIGVTLVALVLFSTSCTKEEGQGGTASIRGKVHARYYNDLFTAYLGEGYDAEEDVYIIYGDEFTYGNHLKTNFDGTYEFRYLRKGNYKVYAYSKDSTFTEPSGKLAVIQEVEISGGNDEVVVPDIEILD